MIIRYGRGVTYDFTDYLLYKNLLIMQNLEKIMLKQAFWLSTFFLIYARHFLGPRDMAYI